MTRPATGVRYVLERAPAEDTQDTLVYRGFAHVPDADLPLIVWVLVPSAKAEARIEASEPRPELEKAAAALVRAAVKPALGGPHGAPRKIVRWRETAAT